MQFDHHVYFRVLLASGACASTQRTVLASALPRTSQARLRAVPDRQGSLGEAANELPRGVRFASGIFPEAAHCGRVAPRARGKCEDESFGSTAMVQVRPAQLPPVVAQHLM